MNKFKIHYGGTSYVDTYDKNRYKLPHIYRFNPSKIKFYKGISKDEYNDVITFNDDTKFELGNIGHTTVQACLHVTWRALLDIT